MNQECRNDDSNYIVLGYIPNIGYGKGKAKKQSSEMKLQDEHNCLSLITNQIVKIHEEGGFWTEVMGRRVCVKIWVHLIAGDTLGHNNLVGHFNGGRPKYIYRECKCTFEELAKPIPTCTLITSDELEQARLTDNGMTDLCKKNIKNAFENVPLSDQKYGLLGMTPGEMLHVSQTGILKHMFGCLDGLIGGPKSKKRDQESFDDLHRCLVMDAQHQSERDFPRMSIRNGITDGTKMCGAERVGNCFILLCVMHTSLGKKLMSKEMKLKKISLKKFIKCLKLYLAFERWVTEPHRKSQVRRSYKVLGLLINLIKKCFPREDGWGWNLPKMHALSRMPHYMMKFGSANNFSGQIGERALKGIVKDHADRTQRRADKFAEQCAIREYECNVIEYVVKDLQQHTLSTNHQVSRIQEKIELRGKFTVHFSKTNSRGIGVEGEKIVWHDSKREKMKITVSDLFLFAIRRFSHSHKYTDEFKVTGYTTLKLLDSLSNQTTTYYATEYSKGQKRYDYAMIDFQAEDGTSSTCPAKILGFIRYDITLGIPTPHFSDDEGLSLDQIHENMAVDNNAYAVIHTASDYLSMARFQEEFVSSFTLGDISQCLYVVKVEAIYGPLLVFRNYGSVGEDKGKLFCALPKSKWGQYFDTQINNSFL